ncbi:hypothetical protein FKW77_000158 [Venturia effusa]|uniref:Uncharacterized protein n=1 Tax=Venturia effusa TaxID=50376 RepID=A0A517LPC2_9PEZI|nr:hypothetical protein FKW77_000158 [Venturia effusa]
MLMKPRDFGMPAYQQGGVAPESAGKASAGLTPLGGNMAALIISLITQMVLVYCLCKHDVLEHDDADAGADFIRQAQRVTAMTDPRQAPLARWLVITLFVTSFIFAFVSAVLRFGIGTNRNIQICHASIWLCLTLYFITKIFIYLYFGEKAWIVRGCRQTRITNQLYRFNIVVAIAPYVLLWALTFAARQYYINSRHICYLGIGRPVLIPLIVWELVLNIYLTILFMIPLRKLYSYQTNSNPGLRKMARRTLVGCMVSLACTIMNLVVLVILDGEPAWLCLMLCNSDVLMNVLVIHWVAHADIERYQQNAPRDSDRAHAAPQNLTLHRRLEKASKDSESSCDDNPRDSAMPSYCIDKAASIDLCDSDALWDGISGVNTSIEAGDGSCRGSFMDMDPKSIKVKIRHERSESATPLQALDRSFSRSKKIGAKTLGVPGA